jgi:hypothetical protein
MKDQRFLKISILICVVSFLAVRYGQSTQASYAWTKVIDAESGSSIATDLAENIYVTGRFEQTVNFGADFGTSDIKASAGSSDVFVTQVYADGGYGWSHRVGGTSDDVGNCIDANLTGDSFITGHFTSSVDFGVDFGTTDIKTAGAEWFSFVTKLTVLLPIFDGHDFDGNGTTDIAVWRPSNGR